MNDKQVDILIKAWETYQSMVKGFGDSCWQIKSLCIAIWSGMVSFGYMNNDKLVILLSILVALNFMLLESGLKRIQSKYIYKSNEIEASINDYLVGAEVNLSDSGVSTNFDIPSLKEFFILFRLRSWMFWVPYLFMILTSIFLPKIIVN